MCVLRYDPNKVDDYSKKELAELVFSGQVSRKQVDEDGLFRKHRPMLDEELSLMEQDERDWTEATRQNTKESYQFYLDKYNPTIIEGETLTDGWVEKTVYVGRHVDDAIRLSKNVRDIADDIKYNNDDAAAWAAAETDDTIAGYSKYITQYDKQPPLYRGQYVDEAKLRIRQIQDESDWTEATDVETIESYKKYLSKYAVSAPAYRGAHVSEAKEAIERLISKPEPENPLKHEMEDWANAVRADNIEEYKSYLAEYEAIGGNYVAQAKAAIERLLEEKAWSEALKNNDTEGFKKYINLYKDKNGKHLADAELRLNQLEDDLAWMAACKKDSLSSYHVYLSNYDVLSPKYRGRHIEDAKRRIVHIDDKEWEKAIKANTLTAYRLYLSKFDGGNSTQKGKHHDEARKQINRIMDDDCWANAVKQDSIDAYQDYLEQYPNGTHADEAQKKIRLIPPTPWFKYVMVLVIVAVCAFLYWQYTHMAWPFCNIESKLDQDTVEIVSSEQEQTKDEGIHNSLVNDKQSSQDSVLTQKENVDTTQSTNRPLISENNNSSNVSAPSRKKQVKAPTTIKDYEELAISGDKSTYAILAKKYLNKNNYDMAAYWANKAWSANANRALAKEVIEYLSEIDYYEGAKYKKPY